MDHVERVTSTKLPSDGLICEVRTIFGDDEHSDFDHVTVSMYEFLGALPGAVVYDDQHRDIISSRI